MSNHIIPKQIYLWSDFVKKDHNYSKFKEKILALYKDDTIFNGIVNKQALAIYTKDQQKIYVDKRSFIEMTKKDLLEHCVYTLIAIDKNYYYEFYPGRQCPCLDYINDYYLGKGEISHLLQRVNVTFHTPREANIVSAFKNKQPL